MAGGQLPPGFRFFPTDEELIVHYLHNQAAGRPCHVTIISEVNVYRYDPWNLPGLFDFSEGEHYFFCKRERKYPNGARPNRATKSGYWKATGTDKPIYSNTKYVGIKKTLVFYQGQPPKGTKSDWIMHEYRLSSSSINHAKHDEWVLCRIYNKKKNRAGSNELASPATNGVTCHSPDTTVTNCSGSDAADEKPVLPRTCSLENYLLDYDYLPATSSLFYDEPSLFGSVDELFDFSGSESVKLVGNQTAVFNHPVYQH